MDYDALIAQAREYVPNAITVDMCKHNSITVPTFWLFAGKEQIGCAAFEPRAAMPWRGTRMRRGMPYAQQHFVAMDHALRYAAA